MDLDCRHVLDDGVRMGNVVFSEVPISEKEHSRYNGFHYISFFQLFREIEGFWHALDGLENHFDELLRYWRMPETLINFKVL